MRCCVFVSLEFFFLFFVVGMSWMRTPKITACSKQQSIRINMFNHLLENAVVTVLLNRTKEKRAKIKSKYWIKLFIHFFIRKYRRFEWHTHSTVLFALSLLYYVQIKMFFSYFTWRSGGINLPEFTYRKSGLDTQAILMQAKCLQRIHLRWIIVYWSKSIQSNNFVCFD